MKTRDLAEMKQKAAAELYKMLADLKSQIEKESVNLAVNKLKNTNLVKGKKKDIARILTILGEKESVLTYSPPSGTIRTPRFKAGEAGKTEG